MAIHGKSRTNNDFIGKGKAVFGRAKELYQKGKAVYDKGKEVYDTGKQLAEDPIVKGLYNKYKKQRKQ